MFLWWFVDCGGERDGECGAECAVGVRVPVVGVGVAVFLWWFVECGS